MSGEESVTVHLGLQDYKIIHQWNLTGNTGPLGLAFLWVVGALVSASWLLQQGQAYQSFVWLPIYLAICGLLAFAYVKKQVKGLSEIRFNSRRVLVLQNQLNPLWGGFVVPPRSIRYMFVETNLFSSAWTGLLQFQKEPSSIGYSLAAVLENGQKVYLFTNIKSEKCARHLEKEVRHLMGVSLLPMVRSPNPTRPLKQPKQLSMYHRALLTFHLPARPFRLRQSKQAIYERIPLMVDPVQMVRRSWVLVSLIVLGFLSLLLQVVFNLNLGIVLLLLATVGIVLLANSFLITYRNVMLFQRGSLIAFGRVQDQLVIHQKAKTLYRIKVKFQRPEQGKEDLPIQVWANVKKDFFDELSVGQGVSVRYAVKKPQLMFLEDEVRPSMPQTSL